jgi:hypothetical protein
LVNLNLLKVNAKTTNPISAGTISKKQVKLSLGSIIDQINVEKKNIRGMVRKTSITLSF